MAELRSEKFVWVTWLSRLMVGEITCGWAPWFKTRYKIVKPPSDSDQASWKAVHNRMLFELQKQLDKEGKETLLENENSFRFSVSGVILAGQPDLIALSENEIEVYDCKTGQPKDSDQIQMMIYMYYLSQMKKDLIKERTLKGYLIYKNQRIEIPAEKIDQEFKENLQYFLEFLANDKEPKRRPSPQECSFCEISKIDCPEKIEKIIKELPEY